MADGLNSENQQLEVGKLLKEYFEKQGLTQQYIASKLGVSQAAVSALLNGKPFGKKLAYKWGKEFGLKPNWLLTGEGRMLDDYIEPSNLEDTNLNSNIMNESQVQKLFEMFESQQKIILGLVESNQKLVEANQKLADSSLIHARSVEVIMKRIEFDETNPDETDLDKVKKSQAS